MAEWPLKTAVVPGSAKGIVNGMRVVCAILAFQLWITISGVTGILGSVGGNLGDIPNVLQNNQSTATRTSQQAAQQIDSQRAQDMAWEGLG